MVCESEVHVVATQKNMIPDGHTCELQIAVLFGYSDQGEVGRTAAHIDHKDDVSDFDRFSERVAHALDPGIKRRLRLFEQRYIMEPGLFGGLCGQFARSRIERRRNREDDLLGIEIAFSRHLPRTGEMPEISRGSFDRRNASHFRRRLPRQQSTRSIHAAVAQPALRRCDEARRHFCAVTPRKFAGGVRDFFIPWDGEGAVWKLSFLCDIYKGWQQQSFFGDAWCGQLRNENDISRTIG